MIVLWGIIRPELTHGETNARKRPSARRDRPERRSHIPRREQVLDKTDVRDPANGYFDICYSPDDGGWYADLMFDARADCPTCDTSAEAEQWALHHGGKRRLR